MGIENAQNYELEVDIGDSNLKCFYRATHNYGSFYWQSIPVRVKNNCCLCRVSLTRRDNDRGRIHMSPLSLTRRDNERRRIHMSPLSLTRRDNERRKIHMSPLSLTRRDNERRRIHMSPLSLTRTNNERRRIHMSPLSQEEFEIPKRVIRIRKSKKDRQHNG